eukprot:2671244-Amphidinium_carterae.1
MAACGLALERDCHERGDMSAASLPCPELGAHTSRETPQVIASWRFFKQFGLWHAAQFADNSTTCSGWDNSTTRS